MEYLDSKSLLSTDGSKSVASHHSQNSGSVSNYQILSSNSKDNVKVVIRVRPLNEREKSHGGSKKCITVDNRNTVTIEQKPDTKVFNFDFVGDEELDQETVFNQIAKPIADCCLEGYNGSIFAYGQTGAGKTFTIQGPSVVSQTGEEQMLLVSKKDVGLSGQDYEKVGLMPRSFEYIFDCVESAKAKAELANDGFTFLIRCSYLEIYNEQIMDLLEPSSVNLHIREDIKKGVYVEGLIEENVSNAQEMVQLIGRGSRNRHVGSTSMNKESSRSHSVLTTIIETKSMKDGGGVWNIKTARFHIIDLAGSERQKFTGAVGERLKEAGMINKSLSALGNVINSLVDISEGKNRHVHYRDSKLTFLLRDSLGGNSKTVIIANISPSSVNYGETLSTLKFAQRAKLIRNKAVINEDSSGTISLLRGEINRLKKDLAESEQRAQSLGQQCAFCRNNIGNENLNGMHNHGLFDEDVDLLSETFNGLVEDIETNQDGVNKGGDTSVLISGQLNEAVKNRLKYQKADLFKMRERVVYLEGLLSSNLDNMTSQQKFYESEIQKLTQQNKKLQQSVESYEKQCTRDKMIIKFREDRITKLENSSGKPETPDEKQAQLQKIISDMKKEILVWKESTDHNAQASKLFAEKAELTNKLESLKKELKQTPDSLSAQMRSMSELNDSLNQYLKVYCEESKKNVENELAKAKLDYSEKLDSLNTKMEEIQKVQQVKGDKYEKEEQLLKTNIIQQKQENERIKKEFASEKEEIEKINKQTLEEIKNQFEQVSGDKTEQERELQHLKVRIIEIGKDQEKELLNFNEKLQNGQHFQNELQQTNAKLEQQLRELEEQQINIENQQKKLNDSHKMQLEEEKKSFTSQLNEQSEIFEKKLFELEKQIMDDQNERDIIFEQSEQLSIRIKSLEDENENFQRTILYKEEEIKESKGFITEKEHELQSLNDQIIQVNILSQNSLSNKQSELNKLEEERNQLYKEINQLKESTIQYQKDIEELKKGMEQINQEYINLKIERQSLLDELSSNQTKIQELLSTIQNLQQDQQVLIKDYEEKIVSKQEELKIEVQAISQQKEENINSKEEEIRTLEDKVDILQSQIFEIKEMKDDLKQKVLEQNKTIEKGEKEIKELKDLTEQMVSQIQLLEQDKQELQIDKAQLILKQEELYLQSQQQLENQQSIEKQKDQINSIYQILQEDHEKFKQEKSLQEINLSQIIETYTQEIQQKEKWILEKEGKIGQSELQIEKLKQQVEVLQSQIKDQEVEYQQYVSQIKEEYTTEKEQITEKCEIYQSEILKSAEQIVVLVKSKAQELEQLQTKYEIKIEEIQKENQNQQAIIIEEHQQKIEEVIQQKEDTATHIQKQLEEKINQEKILLNSEIENKEQEFENTINQLQIEITVLQNRLESETSAYQQQIAEKEEMFKDSLQKQESKLNENLENKIKETSKEKEKEIIEIEEKNNQIQQELKNQIIKLTQQTESIIEQKNALKDQIQNLKQSKEQNSVQYQETILNVQNDYESKIALLQKQLDGWTQHKTNLNQQLEQISQSFESQLKMKDQVLAQASTQFQLKETELQDELEQRGQDYHQIRDKYNQVLEEKASLLSEIQNYKQQENSNKSRMSDAQVKVQSLQKDIEMQKKLLDNTLEQLNNEHIRKYQEIENEHQLQLQTFKNELDQYKSHCKDQQNQIHKLKERNEEQKDMLKNSKDTISGMVSKENDLMVDLEKKINELKEHQEGYRKRVQELRDEKDQLKKEWERMKKENDNLRELVKLKDRQIEETVSTDEKDREVIEKVQKENKDMRNQLIKRDFEMKEIIKTLKLFQEEKNRLQVELDKLQRENDQLIGHKNPNQKIQHHLKIKEENNKLREENFKLMEELRRKTEILAKGGKSKDINSMQEEESNSSNGGAGKEEIKKLKKENINYQETINRLVDHIISQPGLMKTLGLSEEMNEKIQQQNGTGKVKNAMEIISLFSSALQAKERDFKDIQREKKKIECRLDIVEKEKNLCKQQLELLQQTSASNSYVNNVQYQTKSPNASVNRLVDNQMYYHQDQQNQHLNPSNYDQNYNNNTSQGRLQVDGFDNKMVQNDFSNNIGFSKKSPSPLYNFKQLKEKENISSSKPIKTFTSTIERDLFNNQRSGSGRRAAYLNKQQ